MWAWIYEFLPEKKMQRLVVSMLLSFSTQSSLWLFLICMKQENILRNIFWIEFCTNNVSYFFCFNESLLGKSPIKESLLPAYFLGIPEVSFLKLISEIYSYFCVCIFLILSWQDWTFAKIKITFSITISWNLENFKPEKYSKIAWNLYLLLPRISVVYIYAQVAVIKIGICELKASSIFL